MKNSILFLWLLALVACEPSQEKPVDENVVKGKEIAQASFKVLSTNLKSAMSRGGFDEAIEFCNVQAMPLTDSLSAHFGAKIRRTSLHYRNPQNKPDSLEMATLVSFQKTVKAGGTVEPVVIDHQGKKRFFAPILAQSLCLNCHGLPGNEVSLETMTLIKEHYPEDMATGYKVGDLRGAWSITFEE